MHSRIARRLYALHHRKESAAVKTPNWTWLVALLAVSALVSASLACAVASPKLFRDLVLFRIGDLLHDLPQSVMLFALAPVLFVGALVLKTLLGGRQGYSSRGWTLPDSHGPRRGDIASRS